MKGMSYGLIVLTFLALTSVVTYFIAGGGQTQLFIGVALDESKVIENSSKTDDDTGSDHTDLGSSMLSSTSSGSAHSSVAPSSKPATSSLSSAIPSEQPPANSVVPAPPSSSSSNAVVFPVNINTATQKELMAVDGMQEEWARLIVLYREKGGAYTDIKEILFIDDIDKAVFYGKIQHQICV